MSEALQQTKKIALVSGSNKGIGLQVVRDLGRAGMKVLLGARNRVLGTQAVTKLVAEGLDVSHVTLDLGSDESIVAVSKLIRAEYGHLDVLVNNAGIVDSGDGTPGVVDKVALRRVFETNFFQTVAVTQALLPWIKLSAAGRIVNVSSSLGSLALNSDPAWGFAPYKLLAYNASKAALNMMTIQLAYELRGTSVKVNSANPGFTATEMNGHTGTQTVEEGAREIVRLALLPDDGPTGSFSDNGGPVSW